MTGQVVVVEQARATEEVDGLDVSRVSLAEARRAPQTFQRRAAAAVAVVAAQEHFEEVRSLCGEMSDVLVG